MSRPKLPIQLEKYCPRCSKMLEISNFGKSKSRSTGIQYYCIECMKSYKKEKRDANPKRTAAYRRKWKYGISFELYDKLFIEQNGRCAICKEATELVLDHNHETNEIRGLLCRSCNWGLGQMKDSILILSSAIEYLGKV